MPGSWPQQDHPGLTPNNCLITSPRTNAYNCIAWAAGDTSRWWWPVPLGGIAYWPSGVPREETVESFVAAFATKGFVPCQDGSLENGVEKIAIFCKQIGGLIVPRHASRQLESGDWTSKMGGLEDITHATVAAVDGPIYGQVASFMSRPRINP
jgi:hypothetical protein